MSRDSQCSTGIIGWLGTVSLCLVALSGCGKEEIPRYTLSGAATYGGQPIPAGVIQFAPDGSLSNKGPGSVGEIQNGKYETRDGKGIVGGAYIVTIRGYTEGMGAPLFMPPYETKVTLATEDSTYDFDVPPASVKEVTPYLAPDGVP